MPMRSSASELNPRERELEEAERLAVGAGGGSGTCNFGGTTVVAGMASAGWLAKGAAAAAGRSGRKEEEEEAAGYPSTCVVAPAALVARRCWLAWLPVCVGCGL
jgi:hypothetical protein